VALNAGFIAEINHAATASNVNGGLFNPNNANMMTDLAATSATGNSPVVTSATYTFVAGDVGHYVYVKTGTNWTPGFYLIASVAGGAATLTATVGTAEQLDTSFRWITNTVAGCATVASPTGGTFTIDYSRSTASPFASTDIATASNTTLTSATNPFGLNMVGNHLHVTAGTGFTVGWYEIVSVSGTTATIDRSIGTHPLTGGTGKVGGALSLGSSDDAVFELQVAGGSTTAGARYFIKGGGTYTINGTVTIANDADPAWNSVFEGYSSIRGDRPTGSARPTFATGAINFTISGNNSEWRSIIWSGTAASLVIFGSHVRIFDCKFINSSATAGRSAWSNNTSNCFTNNCEFISYRGIGADFQTSNGSAPSFGCSFHDSDIGAQTAVTSAMQFFINCIFYSNVTNALKITGTNAAASMNCFGCTFYGAENKLGKALEITGLQHRSHFINNIIYGFVTGAVGTAATFIIHDNYNNYYNNTNDVDATANWQKGPNDTALDPVFTSVQQRTGTTATTTAGNHLVQTGATFTTWGVTAGTHYLRIVSGTGITVGVYGISSVDSETQITTDITLTADATADKTWSITTGLDFAVGTNMKAIGEPATFPNTATTSYVDCGAVQRQESTSTGGGSFTFAG